MVVNGAGSAGVAITKLLLTYGFPHITMCDKSGILARAAEGLNWMQEKMMEVTNLEGQTGTLADAMKGADIFVGVSAPGIVTAGHGGIHESRCDSICHGKPGSGDHA